MPDDIYDRSQPIIVPIVRFDATMSVEAALKMLANGDAFSLTWEPDTDGVPGASAYSFGADSTFATSLNKLIEQALGADMRGVPGHIKMGLPIKPLAEKILGSAGAGIKGAFIPAAAARAGAKPAVLAGGFLGLEAAHLTVLGTLLLAQVTSHMIVTSRLDKLQDSIGHLDLQVRWAQQDGLNAGRDIMTKASLALLDGIAIPDSVGVGPAMHAIRTYRKGAERTLDAWEGRYAQAKKEEKRDGNVATDNLIDDLASDSHDPVGFVGWQALTAYFALALDARAVLLAHTEASARNPGLTLRQFTDATSADLTHIEQCQLRLLTLFQGMAALSLADPGVFSNSATFRKVDQTRKLFKRLKKGLALALPAPPPESIGNRIVLNLTRGPSGEIAAAEPPHGSSPLAGE